MISPCDQFGQIAYVNDVSRAWPVQIPASLVDSASHYLFTVILDGAAHSGEIFASRTSEG